MESFGRLGEEGYEFIDELATHAAGGRDGGSMAQKGVFKERLLLQVISVATQRWPSPAESSGTSCHYADVNTRRGEEPD